VSVTERPVKLPPTLAVQASVEARQAEQIAKQRVGLVTARGDIDSQLVYLPLGDQLRLAWKTTLPALEPLGDWLVYVDALDGKVLKVQDLIRYECTIPPPSPGACVFDPSPVVEQCSWAGLADNGDADSPLLTALRVGVELLGLQTSGNPLGRLIGEYVDLTAPGITGGYLPAGVCQEPSFVYDKTRSDECFEEATAYYHVDAVQRKIQTLGFTGPKAIYASAIPVHAHYMPDANAFYSGYDKGLHFGDGGVDTAEDGDVVVHEYGHALLDDQVPNIETYEGACVHEGFADVLSALVFFEHDCDEACVGEWFNAEAQLCLRRTDGTKHYPEDMHYWDPHEDGEIWSGAVWGLLEALGGDVAARDKVLTLILEGHFFLDPESGLRDAASGVIAADEGLYGGADVPVIEAVFASRGLAALPAPNDDFDDAIPVEPLPFTDFHDTGDATVAVDDPATGCVGSYGHTVWYRLDVPTDMIVNLDTFDSAYNTVLAVYTGTRGALTEEVCNDDSGSPQSFVSLSAVGGVTYHIMVASYGDEPAGALTFHATVPPPNDNLDNAIIIPDKPFVDFVSTDGATTEDGEPEPCDGITNTVWYAFSETTDQFAQAHTFGSGFDTVLAVYSGPPPGLATFDDLTLIDCNNDYGGWESKVSFAASAGVTYYFQVGGFYGATGDLQFNLGPVVGPDVTVDKSDSADPVGVGEQFSYVLQVSNVGPEEATGVTLDDALPWDVEFVGASPECTWQPPATPTPPPPPPPPSPTAIPALAATPIPTATPLPPTDGVVHCDLPDLAPGESQFVTIDVLAPPYSAWLYNNVGIWAANEPTENGGNNWDWEDTYVGEPGPSVTVYKYDWPDPVVGGEVLSYWLDVVNFGTDIAVDVIVEDDLPPEVQFVSASPECTWMPAPMSAFAATPTATPPTVIPPTPSGPDGTVHCDLPDLPPGAGYGVNIIVLAPEESGIIWNQACVSASNEPPENQGDNCTRQDTTVVTPCSPDDLAQAIVAASTQPYLLGVAWSGVPVQCAVFDTPLQQFPTDSASFGVISSGMAGFAAGSPEEEASLNTGTGCVPGGSPDGYDACDLATFDVTLQLPPDASELTFDWAFGTEEGADPENPFQDFFTAYVGGTNIALLPDDSPATVNNAYPFSTCPPDPPDIVYDCVTPMYTASLDVSAYAGETITLSFQVADASDPVADSAAFIDNLRIHTGGPSCGDVQCDGDVDAVDALFILQYVVGLRDGSNECPPPPETMYLPACDVDCDYDCDAVDALFVLQYVVGIRPELCVCLRH
jgi:uncharacterized repeat protein (TIGR01451 family)